MNIFELLSIISKLYKTIAWEDHSQMQYSLVL